jgi:DNA processing protein
MNPLITDILNKTYDFVPSIEQYAKNNFKQSYNHAENYIKVCDENCINIITYQDANYPTKLKANKHSPALIFYIGDLSLVDQINIGIVGSREIDAYSTRLLDDGLQRLACPIVSGMAYGIDVKAHQVALSYNRKCVAIIPCGLLKEVFYPKENYQILRQVAQYGLVISQMLPDKKPKRYTFLLRNKLISIISDRLWMVKAAQKSGSISTANYSLEYNKPVYVSVYDIYDPAYRGNIEVVNKGGVPIYNMEILGKKENKIKPLSVTLNEQKIIKCINKNSITLDGLINEIDLSYTEVLIVISKLLKEKIIIEIDNVYYIKN